MRPLTAVACIALLAACAATRIEPLRSGGTLRVLQTQDVPSLNPIFVSGVGGQELGALLYSYLVTLDDQGRLVPDVATEVPTRENGGITGDGRIITYHLRSGVRFSDGSALTSADVAATIDAVRNPDSDVPSRAGFRDVVSVSAPDKQTVVVRLKQAYAPIITFLCAPGNAIPILPKRAVSGRVHLAGGPLDAQPIGSGPYLVRAWRRSDALELVSNPDYFRGEPAIGDILIRFVPSSSTALAMLRAGEADAFVNADDSQYRLLRALPGKYTIQNPIDGTGALFFNTRAGALSDANVRVAIAESINTSAIVVKTLLGAQRARDPGRGLFQWAYDPDAFAMPKYNPRDAARKFDAAGWRLDGHGMRRKDGVPLSFDILARADKPSGVAMATQMQAQLRDAGVALSVRRTAVLNLTSPSGPLYSGHYSLALFPFINGFDPDVRDQFACDRIPPHGFNKPRYCNHHLDVLMASATQVYNRTERTQIYHVVQRVLAGDLPMLAMYQAVSINTFPSTLQGPTAAITTPFWNVGSWTWTSASQHP